MSFKDMIARDIHKVFLNLDEFAEKRTIRYDGGTYEDVPVALVGPTKKPREQLQDDHVQGLHLVAATLYCARENLGGKLPKPEQSIQISTREGGKFFDKYYVVASTCEMGMLRIELEMMGE